MEVDEIDPKGIVRAKIVEHDRITKVEYDHVIIAMKVEHDRVIIALSEGAWLVSDTSRCVPAHTGDRWGHLSF